MTREELVIAAVPMLAAAGLAFAGPTMAAADPPATYQTKCTDAVQLTPEINAKTCITGRYANTGQTVFYSTVTVRNTSSSYSVTVDPDLLIDSTTVFGTPITIPPRTEANAYGPSVENPPWAPTRPAAPASRPSTGTLTSTRPPSGSRSDPPCSTCAIVVV